MLKRADNNILESDKYPNVKRWVFVICMQCRG